MIKQNKRRRKYDFGIGLTNNCNFRCKHCYSNRKKIYYIGFEKIRDLCDSLPINSINFGTGESGLHPEFRKILAYVASKGIKTSLTTNGYTPSLLSDEELKLLNDIDFSLDFPNPKDQIAFRQNKYAFDWVADGIERCKKLGMTVSLAATLMKDNASCLDSLLKLSKEKDCFLRINIYKPVHTKKYCMDYDAFWKKIDELFKKSYLVSCSEPIINAALNRRIDTGCGKNSFRIKPNGKVVPCVYLNDSDITLSKLIEKGESVLKKKFDFPSPENCSKCLKFKICGGGCIARRFYGPGIAMPDEFCFYSHNMQKPVLKPDWYKGSSDDFVHSDYLCTLIVKPK